MPRAEEIAVAAAKGPDGSFDYDKYFEVYQQELARRHEQLRHDARAVFSAVDGWHQVRTAEDWQAKVEQATEAIDNGRFLVERLGAERYLEPELLATLLVLRRRLLDEQGTVGAAEVMLIDVALLSYYHTLRINGWIGNFATMIENEFFGTEPLTARMNKQYGYGGKIDGLRAEDYVQRIGEELLPLLDRCNRMMLRNLKALKSLRQPATPSVSIGNAGQVNVAQAQVNASTNRPPETGAGAHA